MKMSQSYRKQNKTTIWTERKQVEGKNKQKKNFQNFRYHGATAERAHVFIIGVMKRDEKENKAKKIVENS